MAQENLERLLASVMGPVESLSPPPKATTNPSPPPSPIAREEVCPFHPKAQVQRGRSAKGWAYVRCPESKCPYWVPAAEAPVISEMTDPERPDVSVLYGASDPRVCVGLTRVSGWL